MFLKLQRENESKLNVLEHVHYGSNGCGSFKTGIISVCMFDQIFNSNSSDLFLSLQTRKTDCLFRVCGQFNPITNDFNNDIEQLIKP